MASETSWLSVDTDVSGPQHSVSALVEGKGRCFGNRKEGLGEPGKVWGHKKGDEYCRRN